MEENWTMTTEMSTEMNKLMTALEVVTNLATRYPNDDTISEMVVILRDEGCQMLGGHIDEFDVD